MTAVALSVAATSSFTLTSYRMVHRIAVLLRVTRPRARKVADFGRRVTDLPPLPVLSARRSRHVPETAVSHDECDLRLPTGGSSLPQSVGAAKDCNGCYGESNPRRQRRNARANWPGVLGFVSPPIGEALPVRTLDRQHGAARVGVSELSARVVSELKFVEVTL
jgi:hypothetical protein